MSARGFRTRLRIRRHHRAAARTGADPCGSGDTSGTTPAGAQASLPPTGDPVAAVRNVDSLAALLPADVRTSGALRAGSSIGFPPGVHYPNGSDKPPPDQDIDIADAVAKVLGVKLER